MPQSEILRTIESCAGADEIIVNIAAMQITNDCNGPGRLLSIHFKGCTLNCSGCYNPQFHSFDPLYLLTTSEVINLCAEIFHQDKGVKGVSLLGGEPLQQPDACLAIAMGVKELNKDLILFTGYTIAELESMDIWKEIFPYIDCAVTGRFDKNKLTIDGYPSSSNQEIIITNSRYSDANREQRTASVMIKSDFSGIIFSGYPICEEVKGEWNT